jgi:hypothetical protein
VLYRILVVEPDGTLVRGGSVSLRSPPRGEPRPLELIGTDGAVLAATGSFYGHTKIDGGLLLVPEPPERVASVRFAGGKLLPLSAGPIETRD